MAQWGGLQATQKGTSSLLDITKTTCVSKMKPYPEQKFMEGTKHLQSGRPTFEFQ